MSFVEWLAQPAGRVLTLTLLHFLWQGTLIVLSLIVMVKLCCVRRHVARYACSLTALLTMTAFPLATMAWLSLEQGPAPSAELLSPGHSPGLFVALATPPDATFLTMSQRWVDTWQPYALAAWLVGVAFLGTRLVAGIVGITKLRRSRLPIPVELRARVARLGVRLQMDALPLVFLSKDVTEAMALGLVRRFVLIPAAWATEMPLEMLEAVIAHELAHLRRMDLWANLLQRIMETLFFYHPAVWWLSRRLSIERELCSDELAVAATGERLVYAQTLEHIAVGRQVDIRPALAAYLQGESNMRLLERIRNVLAPSASERRHWPAGLVALGLAVGLWTLSLTLLDTLTPSAFADEPTQDEANDEQDDQSDEASDEGSAADEQRERDDEEEITRRQVAEALEQVLIDVEQLKELKPTIDAKLDKAKPAIEAKLNTKLDKVSPKVAEKLETTRPRLKQLMAERKEALMQDLEKLKQAGLDGEQLEIHKKALMQEMEKLKAAQLHGDIDAEEQKAKMLEKVELKLAERAKKTQVQAERFAAEAEKSALRESEKQRALAERLVAEVHEKALRENAEHLKHVARLVAEAEKQAFRQSEEQRKQARLQEEAAKQQLHHLHLEKEAMDKALHQRANDERIEKLTAMVQELASQVERLQRDISVLRDQHAGDKVSDEDGDEDAKTRKINRYEAKEATF